MMCCGSECSTPSVQGHGFVSSNNYPRQYDMNSRCELGIGVHEGQVFNLQIIDIDLDYTEEMDRCRDAFVFTQVHQVTKS